MAERIASHLIFPPQILSESDSDSDSDSSDEDDEDDEDEPLLLDNAVTSEDEVEENAERVDKCSQKCRGESKVYSHVKEFDDYKSALREHTESQLWTKRYNKDTDEGEKKYFSCKGQPKCPKNSYILLHSDDGKSSI